MDPAAWVTAIAGIAVVSSGVYIAIHELRRRERKVTHREIEDLIDQVDELRERTGALTSLLLEQRRHIYRLTALMIDAGLDPPQPPAPGFDPGEYDS